MKAIADDLRTQTERLSNVIKENRTIYQIIEASQNLQIPNCYIGAGCIAQTVWNHQVGNDLMYGISDIDFVYYDDSDLSYSAENETIENITAAIHAPGIKLDIKNQARVHLWYKEHFGYDIQPYTSVETAIDTWPTTATAIGVRLESDKLKVYAPFGLSDLFEMIVRANKAQITPDIYHQKAAKWKAKWPSLTIIPW